MVTPLAGVWIEIMKKAPSTESKAVTPLAGVWIEIVLPLLAIFLSSVTPLAGVWIEIWMTLRQNWKIMRHSPCGSVD